MFSRRHPYLFFVLVVSSVAAFAMTMIAFTIMLGLKGPEFEFGEKVGVIEITGIITDSQNIINNLKRFREDDSVKAIVLRIDSPGGGVGPSQEIFREVRKTVIKKKVVASMGAIAASGGYYVAVGADEIMANPGTITGSIGVVMGFTNFQNLLQKIGLVPVVIKSGEYKDIGSPFREMKKEERKILEDFAKKIHRQFIMAIVEGRNMDLSKVEALADGRIFTGEESKGLRLVDRLGNLEDAIEWAGRLGGIEGKISTVYAREKEFSILQFFMGSSIKNLINRVVNTPLYANFLFRP